MWCGDCCKLIFAYVRSMSLEVLLTWPQRDGLEAVNKINNGANHFDLILMDIIMPHLDGVSATVCIREIRPTIPIIAMTSNIRADDIDMYFRYGERDGSASKLRDLTETRHERCFTKTVYQGGYATFT